MIKTFEELSIRLGEFVRHLQTFMEAVPPSNQLRAEFPSIRLFAKRSEAEPLLSPADQKGLRKSAQTVRDALPLEFPWMGKLDDILDFLEARAPK